MQNHNTLIIRFFFVKCNSVFVDTAGRFHNTLSHTNMLKRKCPVDPCPSLVFMGPRQSVCVRDHHPHSNVCSAKSVSIERDCCVTDLNHRRRLNLLVNVKPESTKLAAEEEPAVISAGEGGGGCEKHQVAAQQSESFGGKAAWSCVVENESKREKWERENVW